jgi:hypothetical protein
MEKFNYYFNTKQRIDNALQAPINKNTMGSILFNLIWYAYYNISSDEKNIIRYIEGWMKERNAPFHLSAYARTIKTYITKMKDMPWREFDGVIKIRKSELDYISSFNDIKKEKLLFSYLAVAKFKDEFRETPSHWESEDDSIVFKMARVNIPAKERDYYINKELYMDDKVKIHMNSKNDDVSKRIDYVSDDDNDPVVLELDESNYYELAYTYLNWKNNGGYKKCKKCGKLFRVQTSPARKATSGGVKGSKAQLCWDCTVEYEARYKGKDVMADDYEPRAIECIDCGKIVYISEFNSKSCRCAECQNDADKRLNREASRERMKKYREIH